MVKKNQSDGMNEADCSRQMGLYKRMIFCQIHAGKCFLIFRALNASCLASGLELVCLTAQYGMLVSQCLTFKNYTTKTVLVYGKQPYSKDSAFTSASKECPPYIL